MEKKEKTGSGEIFSKAVAGASGIMAGLTAGPLLILSFVIIGVLMSCSACCVIGQLFGVE